MKRIFLFCLIFHVSSTYSQNPQDFKSLTFSKSSNTISLIYKLASSDDELYFLKSNSTDNQFFSIIKTNSEFQVQHKIDTLKFRGEIITSIPFFEMENDKLLILAKSRNSDFYYSYSYDENLSNLTIIDSLFTKQQYLKAKFKWDNQSEKYNAFGWLTNVSNSSPTHSVYLEINKGVIQNFHQLDRNYGSIPSFSVLPNSLGYLISTFTESTTYFLDIDFNEVDSRKNRFQYIENEITYDAILGPKYYFNQDDKVLCFGRKFENSSYSLNLIETDVLGNKIDWSNVTPLFDNSEDTNDFVELVHTNDTFGNHFLAFQSSAYPADSKITSNTIYLYKFDENLNYVWDIKLKNKNEHFITSINVLNDKSIILAGILNDNLDNPSNNKDFHLKLGSDGNVITRSTDIEISDFIISPNPCTDHLEIHYNHNEKYKFNIYSINGLKVQEDILSNYVDTSNFPAGMYILQIVSNDGIVLNKKFIKM